MEQMVGHASLVPGELAAQHSLQRMRPKRTEHDRKQHQQRAAW